ncbi:[LysW]-aminoadipate/[LysW]-glutamate kinase [Sulfuracidifex tepidarius]|uniref:[LysW]-aminoadipate/[LysW]-glutamate kinase n=1 Tax=Sulfuracidifex tepidarius TaxID=1294262 RepID=A0A510DWI2_9CREN|nr:[LysW]-aminoadipate/[LysW]-glutamate kinase [Sulfuracidifex tepidarius]BBG24576.1 [LysW]-aminoadipate/[LysW]-glutamate kinase [Sulfuracidifex tepidarius]BBG27364.1 [LysW]-aminoadipate/[LysW]-glutamate kinase [Sulfuracidifex tepidarius]
MIVVKTGGRVIKNNLQNLIKSLSKVNEKFVLVHGGGDLVTEYSMKLGVEPKFVTSPEGIRSRYTSKEELDVFIMVMSWINKRIVTGLVNLGRNPIGITGADGKMVIAQRKKRIVIINERGKKMIIEGGFTGKIKEVDSVKINSLLEHFDSVVMSPLAVDVEEGSMLNVDGDQMAYALSTSLKAEYLILLTDVEGVKLNDTVLKEISTTKSKEIVNQIGPGMNRKVLMGLEAVENGVKKVVISSGIIEDPISNALSENGTVIRNG